MAEHTILIVEDDATVRELLRYRLQKQDPYTVRTAANGKEALAIVQESPPDLIISDIMMPEMDGFALQDALQNDRDTRTIPFIFLTARADEPARREGGRLGVDDYITKPFDMERLLSRVQRLLERTTMFREQLDAELSRDFSERLMPKELPAVEGYRLDFHTDSFEQGGGDLFDWTRLSDGTYFFTIGDVMGKGVRAKFYAFSFLSYVRSTLLSLVRDTHAPGALLEKLNTLFLEDNVLDETYASLLLIHWAPDTHTITYANAGHCRPVLYRNDAVAILEESDLLLGLEPDATYHDVSRTLAPGDALFTYTDGLTEHPMADGQFLGEDGLLDHLSAWTDRPEAPVDRLLNEILASSNKEQFTDDVLAFWLGRLDA
ncbi:PP2C family protein-serine/threonine phosphatase [Salisaeta longa]|uniref:PP2C family protein-serine/threonine phosphatase n=1 Tax=Salisaeta longa TaxID=503170 RepID=UPI0003F9D590|nr:fused response regulator/phosphatase [Salisaeta longa]